MKTRLKDNKKGNYPDIVEYLKVSLALGFILVFSIIIYNSFDDTIQAQSNETIPQIVKDVSADTRTSVPPLLDILFPFVLVFFVAFSVVAARLIPSTPKFIIISIIALILLPLGAMMVENIWYGFAQNAMVIPILAGLKFTPFIMNHLTIIVLLYSAAVAVALLTKDEVGE